MSNSQRPLRKKIAQTCSDPHCAIIPCAEEILFRLSCASFLARLVAKLLKWTRQEFPWVNFKRLTCKPTRGIFPVAADACIARRMYPPQVLSQTCRNRAYSLSTQTQRARARAPVCACTRRSPRPAAWPAPRRAPPCALPLLPRAARRPPFSFQANEDQVDE